MFFDTKEKDKEIKNLKEEIEKIKKEQCYWESHLILLTMLEGAETLNSLQILTDFQLMKYIKGQLDFCKNYISSNLFNLKGFKLNPLIEEKFKEKEIETIVRILNIAKGNFTTENLSFEKKSEIIYSFIGITNKLLISLVDPKSGFNISNYK